MPAPMSSNLIQFSLHLAQKLIQPNTSPTKQLIAKEYYNKHQAQHEPKLIFMASQSFCDD